MMSKKRRKSKIKRKSRNAGTGIAKDWGFLLTGRGNCGEIRGLPMNELRLRSMDKSQMTSASRMKRGVPEGLWIRCPQCKATIFRKEAEARFNVCPECHHHFYVAARDRIRQLLDEESFEEWFTNLYPRDPLGFKDRVIYSERLVAEQAKTGMPDAAVVGKG